MKVVIAGGGTAGHVNPAIALARALDLDDVTLVGTDRGVEARLVPEAGLPLEKIDIAGFDRAKPWTLITSGSKAVAAVARSRTLLKRLGTDVVVGMGGYVSLPVCFAARSAGIPVVLHEQNIVLGLAHRASKPIAEKLAVSFEETLREAGDKGVYTGNPILPYLVDVDIEAARASGFERFELDPGRRTILIFGGSLGARRVNDAAAGLASVWLDRTDLQILHITGRDDEERVRSQVHPGPGGGLIYRIVPFVQGMGEAYGIADLAVCRGGATTVAELCVLGVPSVIVPYPYHRDRQQERHGRVLERAGAARVLLDAATNAESLAAIAGELLDNPETLASMRKGAAGLGRPEAARALASVVRGVAR